MGAVIAPLTLLGGPLMLRAAWYTAGIVGGLSTVAMCAPSEKFLNMGGPLAVGFGVVFASSLGEYYATQIWTPFLGWRTAFVAKLDLILTCIYKYLLIL